MFVFSSADDDDTADEVSSLELSTDDTVIDLLPESPKDKQIF